MLTHLRISNFAIIEELDLQWRAGMTVLTGETGAGKSILIDALGLILGDRAESGLIRAGCERAEVTASFIISGNRALLDLLEEQQLDAGEGELLIRRVLNRDGPSRAFVNSSPVAVQLLKTLGERLIDVHGQHAHQSLMRRDSQRDLLDSGADHAGKLDAVRQACKDWQAATRSLKELDAGGKDTDSRLALLQYQVQELAELDLQADEYTRLQEEHRRLSHASRLLETGQSLANLLHEDDQSLHTQLGQAVRELQELQRLDPSLDGIVELLDAATIQLDEGAGELRHYLERLELDPEKLAQTEKRLDALHAMARKHQARVEELPEHLQSLQEQLQALTDSEDRIKALKEEQAASLERYRGAAGSLHDSRSRAADTMGKDVSAYLQRLGMPEGRLQIEVTAAAAEQPRPAGSDQVEFLVALNPGQPAQPLRKVASGGELSRISLAIQVVSRDTGGVPTFIFDEVDAGIGGGVAEIVGSLLHGLTDAHQVLCVTHLPQVASQSDHHLRVEKSTDKKTTRTSVKELDDEQRVEEVARMLGGMKISDKTREHAREMLGATTDNR